MHRRRGALLFLSRVILSGAGLGHTFLDIRGMVFLLGFLVAFFWIAILFLALGRRRLAFCLLLESDAAYYLQ
jgi:hypothetical protein